jgi:hypothetical protein
MQILEFIGKGFASLDGKISLIQSDAKGLSTFFTARSNRFFNSGLRISCSNRCFADSSGGNCDPYSETNFSATDSLALLRRE